jgi:hypothetical protein
MVGMSSSSCSYQCEHEKREVLGNTKRVTYLKLDVLDGHLFRDSYLPYSSFHHADPFRLSLGFHVPRTICENACLAGVYHDWVVGIRFWRGVWIFATQDADRDFRQIIIRFPTKAFNITDANSV